MQSITTEQMEYLKEFIVYTDENVEEILSYYDSNDTTYFIDVSFNVLIDDLLYNGLSYQDILISLNVMYGSYIDIYYLESDKIYIMVIVE